MSVKVPTTEELRDWVIAYITVETGYFGRPVSEPDDFTVHLDPAFIFVGQYGLQIAESGQILQAQRSKVLVPIELSVGITSVHTKFMSLTRMSDLTDADFKDFAPKMRNALEEAERMRGQIRAQRAGIVLTKGELPKGAAAKPGGGLIL